MMNHPKPGRLMSKPVSERTSRLRSRRRDRRPRVEGLEERMLLAYTAVLSGTTATFVGNSASDVLIFDSDIVFDVDTGADRLVLRHNRFTAGDPGFASDVDFDSFQPGNQLLDVAAASRVIVDAGPGDDDILIGSVFRSPATAAADLLATFVLNGGAGEDIVGVDNSVDQVLGRAIDINNQRVTFPTSTTIVEYSGIELLDVVTGGGNVTVAVASTAQGVETRVSQGATGNLDVLVGVTTQAPSGGTLDGIQGRLGIFGSSPDSIVGASGFDQVVLNDSTNVANHDYTITSSSVTRDGMATIFFRPPSDGLSSNLIDDLLLLAGEGDDSIQVVGTGSDVPTRTSIHAGGGDDNIALADGVTLNGGTIDGGAIAEMNVLDYSAWTTPVTVDLEPPGRATGTGGVANIRGVIGGSAGDSIQGASAVSNLLDGRGGNDQISAGLGGSSSLGTSNTLLGGEGDDFLVGNEGNDLLRGGLGNDFLEGLGGNDQLFADEGDNTLSGGDGNDSLFGGPGIDLLLGGAGDDRIASGPSDDQIFGDEGDDLIVWSPGDGNDHVDGGPGVNRVVATGSAENDVFTLRRRGASIELTDRASQEFVTMANIQVIDLATMAGDDLLEVDFVEGNPIPALGLNYDGGLGANDRLALFRSGGSFVLQQEVYLPSGPDSGTILLDGLPLLFSGLEPILDTVPTDLYVFDPVLPPGQTINLLNDPIGTPFTTLRIASGAAIPAFELVDLANKTDVTVRATSGDDIVNLNVPLTPAGLAVLTIETQDGNDLVSVPNVMPSGLVTVNVGDDDDQVDVLASGLPNGQTLFVDGGANNDVLNVDADDLRVNVLAVDEGVVGIVMTPLNGSPRRAESSRVETIHITNAFNHPPEPGPPITFQALALLEFQDQLVATFTDPDAALFGNVYTVEIDWGDGTTSPGTVVADPNVPNGFQIFGSHTYMTFGTFPTRSIITDNGGTVVRSIEGANVSLTMNAIPPVVATGTADVLPTFTVLNTNDSGFGSLRQAIVFANLVPGVQTIDFAIPGAGPHTIAPLFALPSITDPVVIDARTQPGFRGLPVVELAGIGLSPAAGSMIDGLQVYAPGSQIYGLAINRFPGAGIRIQEADNTVISTNHIGTDPSGLVGLGNGAAGILIVESSHALIGGDDEAARNVISANGGFGGIAIFDLHEPIDVARARPATFRPAERNRIAGNLIGTDRTGTRALGNTFGVIVSAGQFNVIGGSARNLISGNGTGVVLTGGARNNVVAGNDIGTTLGGGERLGNRAAGVEIQDSPSNVIGADQPFGAAVNLISGNGSDAIRVLGPGSSGNLILGNSIGLDRTGERSIPNLGTGVWILNAPGTWVARNVIAASTSANVQIEGSGAAGNIVASNRIGTNVAGSRAMPTLNAEGGIARTPAGIFVDGAPNNQIGLPLTAGSNLGGNLVAGHQVGVELFNGATGNRVQGNVIGLNSDGTAPIPNEIGVFLFEAASNLVGGSSESEANVIAGNEVTGVRITGALAQANVVSGNRIENNESDGVFLQAPSNQVTGNVISGNRSVGVQLFSVLASGNLVGSNRIGTDATGSLPNGNRLDGVFLNNAPGNTVSGNTISANGSVGLQLSGDSTTGNVIQLNNIGTNAQGQVVPGLGNRFGLFINTRSPNTIEPNNTIAGNTILNVFVAPVPVDPIEAAQRLTPRRGNRTPAPIAQPRGPMSLRDRAWAAFQARRAGLTRR